MSDLDIVQLIKDKTVEFGNERFLEGWNGATERIIKLLEEVALDEDGCFAERMPETLIALIKGEQE